jgi:hypothetical protein
MSKKSSKKARPHRTGKSFNSTYEKNLASMKLLVSYPAFQDEVETIRKKLGIREGGFDAKDGEALKKWYEDNIRKTDEILASSDFSQQVNAIFDKRDRKEINHRTARMQSELLHRLKLPTNYYVDAVKFLTQKYHMPKNYEEHIRKYILTNTISAPTKNFSIVIHEPKAPLSKMRYVPLEIYARLTDEDLKEIKQCVDEWIGERLPKFQTLKNIDRTLTIEQWQTNRERYDAVEDTRYKRTPDEISQELLGDKKQKKKLYEIPRQLRSLRERRFGKH